MGDYPGLSGRALNAIISVLERGKQREVRRRYTPGFEDGGRGHELRNTALQL